MKHTKHLTLARIRSLIYMQMSIIIQLDDTSSTVTGAVMARENIKCMWQITYEVLNNVY